MEAFFQSPNNDGFQKASAITILVQHEPSLIIYGAFHMVMCMNFGYVILPLDIELLIHESSIALPSRQLVATHRGIQ